MEKYLIIKTKISVAGDYNDDGDYICDGENDIDVEHSIINLDEAIKEKEFLEFLETEGFYHKDDITNGTRHTDKFVYDVLHQNCPQPALYKNLSDVFSPYNASISSVYQEVVGPERLKEVKEFEKKRATYERMMEEQNKKKDERKILAAEKKRQKQIEKARKLLEENEKD